MIDKYFNYASNHPYSQNLFLIFLIPLLLLYPDHGLSEPLDLLLNLLAAESLAPVCREQHLHCLPINLDVVFKFAVFFILFIFSGRLGDGLVEEWGCGGQKRGGRFGKEGS